MLKVNRCLDILIVCDLDVYTRLSVNLLAEGVNTVHLFLLYNFVLFQACGWRFFPVFFFVFLV